jgi:phospholipase/carboxylesterase
MARARFLDATTSDALEIGLPCFLEALLHSGHASSTGARCAARCRLSLRAPVAAVTATGAEAMTAHLVDGDADRTPLILLHGTGGTERDLLPLAYAIAPGAAAVALRGPIATEGGFAFFRRFPDRRIDEADVSARVSALGEAIAAFHGQRGRAARPLAVGFSNGAIMSAALLMTHPALLSGAILFRPLAPFGTPPRVRLDGVPVLVVDGEEDERRSPGDGLLVARQLEQLGATVTRHVIATGHPLTDEDRRLARDWLLDAGL